MSMPWRDYVLFAMRTLWSSRTRTLLIVLAMSLGVASVIALTALGEGARLYVNNQFSSLGTNLLIVIPGRSETTGVNPSTMVGSTPRDLTLADADVLLRSVYVQRIAPVMIGSVPIAYQGRERESVVIGTTSEMMQIRHYTLSQGQFLQEGDSSRAAAVCVIGSKLRDELFGSEPALGEWLKVGVWRFRVIGILAKQGQSIGMNTDELIMIPVASAQALFNSPTLFRIFVEAKSHELLDKTKDDVRRILTARHQGEEDITILTQDAVVATFNKILGALTMAIGGIAAISLFVAGILIMNVMLVAITQRTAEIGLLKAVGAPGQQILKLFMVEAFLLALMGCIIGVVVGVIATAILRNSFSDFPASAPTWAYFLAVLIALGTALMFSYIPARRAARLDAVTALSRR
jgi:putative ABC transport system permease protein